MSVSGVWRYFYSALSLLVIVDREFPMIHDKELLGT